MFKCCYLKTARQLGLCNMFPCLYNGSGISIPNITTMFKNLVLNFIFTHVPQNLTMQGLCFQFYSSGSREMGEIAQRLRAFTAFA